MFDSNNLKMINPFHLCFGFFLLLVSQGFSSSFQVVELEGEVGLDRPGQARSKLEKTTTISEWDRINLPEKSKLKLKVGGETTLEFSKNSLIQIVRCKCSKELRLRLLKGRVRVENSSKACLPIETLNAVLKVPFGKTDVIISAMNTLVAPREGDMVKVGTKKVSKTVSTGYYGLVMSDGTFIKTAAVTKGSQNKEKEE